MTDKQQLKCEKQEYSDRQTREERSNKRRHSRPPMIPVPRLSPIPIVLVTAIRAEHPTPNPARMAAASVGSIMHTARAMSALVASPSPPKMGKGVRPLSMRFWSCASPQNIVCGTKIPTAPTRAPAITPAVAARYFSSGMTKQK